MRLGRARRVHPGLLVGDQLRQVLDQFVQTALVVGHRVLLDGGGAVAAAAVQRRVGLEDGTSSFTIALSFEILWP